MLQEYSSLKSQATTPGQHAAHWECGVKREAHRLSLHVAHV